MSGLDELRSWTPPEYPGDVPEEIEDRIAQVVSDDNGIEIFHRYRKKQIKFASVVYWTLESEYDDISDRRKSAQETAIDLFNWSDCQDPQAYILNICGKQVFKGVEYQRKELHVQNKWQYYLKDLSGRLKPQKSN